MGAVVPPAFQWALLGTMFDRIYREKRVNMVPGLANENFMLLPMVNCQFKLWYGTTVFVKARAFRGEDIS